MKEPRPKNNHRQHLLFTEFKQQVEQQPIKPAKVERKSVEDAVAEREQLKNTAFAQDITLKRNTLIILFIFLGVESLLVFLYAFFQGVKAWGFALEEWSFRLLLTGTIIQITLMVQIAVKHLFPTPEEKNQQKAA